MVENAAAKAVSDPQALGATTSPAVLAGAARAAAALAAAAAADARADAHVGRTTETAPESTNAETGVGTVYDLRKLELELLDMGFPCLSVKARPPPSRYSLAPRTTLGREHP